MVSLPPIPMKTQCAAVITNRMSIKHTLVRVNRSGHAIPCTTVAVYLVLPVGETCPGRFKMPRVDTKYSVGGRAVRAFTRRQYCALPGDCPLAHKKINRAAASYKLVSGTYLFITKKRLTTLTKFKILDIT